MADTTPRPGEPGPSSPATQSSHGTIPFPRSPSADDVANIVGHVRARSETTDDQEPYDVRTNVEHHDRFRTVVRTVISLNRRGRRQSEPGPRPTIATEEHELHERTESASARARGAPTGAPRSPGTGAVYPSIGDRLAGGEIPPREGKKVSFDRDDAARGLFARLYSTTSRNSDRSDPLPFSTAQAARVKSPLSPEGRSTSPPRNNSPLRRWMRRRNPEDLYRAQEHDPFLWRFKHARDRSPSIMERAHIPTPHLPELPPNSIPLARAYVGFLLKQAYISFLLRLPALYFSRVGRLFMEADLTKKEMARIIQCMHSPEWEFDIESSGDGGSALREFKTSWEEFVDHVIKEWKTLNLVSALLLTAILTLFQIEVSNEPVTHTCGLLSLVCALMSLIFGCMYIIRFSTMRTMSKAARWAQAAQATQTNPLWNVWIFLALPSVFLAWALIFFIVTILAYTWTSDPLEPPEYLSPPRSWISRAFISFVALLGLLALCGVVSTFKSYSDEPGMMPAAFGSPLINVVATPRSSGEQPRTSAAAAVPAPGGSGSGTGTVTDESPHTAGLGLTTGTPRGGNGAALKPG